MLVHVCQELGGIICLYCTAHTGQGLFNNQKMERKMLNNNM
jgi:hypothetical protein